MTSFSRSPPPQKQYSTSNIRTRKMNISFGKKWKCEKPSRNIEKRKVNKEYKSHVVTDGIQSGPEFHIISVVKERDKQLTRWLRSIWRKTRNLHCTHHIFDNICCWRPWKWYLGYHFLQASIYEEHSKHVSIFFM